MHFCAFGWSSHVSQRPPYVIGMLIHETCASYSLNNRRPMQEHPFQTIELVHNLGKRRRHTIHDPDGHRSPFSSGRQAQSCFGAKMVPERRVPLFARALNGVADARGRLLESLFPLSSLFHSRAISKA
jgi:hypothetical protein